MKALIIGAAGFVGRHLYRHLSQDLRWDVAVTKLPNETLDIDARTFDMDILDENAVSALLDGEKPDVVFHLAAQSSVALSWKKPDLTVDVNVKGALHLLDAVRLYKGRMRVVLIGSGEEYGYVQADEVPISEDNPLRPGNVYAMTKVAQTLSGQIYARAYGVDAVMARAFNHIGPGQLPQFVVSNFCKQVAKMEAGLLPPVMKVGNLSARRDFTDVRDVVRAYGLIAQKGIGGTVYNVGSGQAYSIEEILSEILSQSAVSVRVEVDPSRLRPSDVPVLLADIQKLKKDTGFVAAIPLETSVADTLAYWRHQLKQEK